MNSFFREVALLLQTGATAESAATTAARDASRLVRLCDDRAFVVRLDAQLALQAMTTLTNELKALLASMSGNDQGAGRVAAFLAGRSELPRWASTRRSSVPTTADDVVPDVGALLVRVVLAVLHERDRSAEASDDLVACLGDMLSVVVDALVCVAEFDDDDNNDNFDDDNVNDDNDNNNSDNNKNDNTENMNIRDNKADFVVDEDNVERRTTSDDDDDDDVGRRRSTSTGSSPTARHAPLSASRARLDDDAVVAAGVSSSNVASNVADELLSVSVRELNLHFTHLLEPSRASRNALPEATRASIAANFGYDGLRPLTHVDLSSRCGTRARALLVGAALVVACLQQSAVVTTAFVQHGVASRLLSLLALDEATLSTTTTSATSTSTSTVVALSAHDALRLGVLAGVGRVLRMASVHEIYDACNETVRSDFMCVCVCECCCV